MITYRDKREVQGFSKVVARVVLVMCKAEVSGCLCWASDIECIFTEIPNEGSRPNGPRLVARKEGAIVVDCHWIFKLSIRKAQRNRWAFEGKAGSKSRVVKGKEGEGGEGRLKDRCVRRRR